MSDDSPPQDDMACFPSNLLKAAAVVLCGSESVEKALEQMFGDIIVTYEHNPLFQFRFPLC